MDNSSPRDSVSEARPELGHDLAGDLKAEARQGFDQIKQSGQQVLGEGQSRLADHVERIGRALKHGGQRLHDEQELSLGDYAQRLGAGCDRLAGYVRERSPRQLLDDIGTQVRRHPELVLGGLFIAGVSVARLLRASPMSQASRPKLADEVETKDQTLYRASAL